MSVLLGLWFNWMKLLKFSNNFKSGKFWIIHTPQECATTLCRTTFCKMILSILTLSIMTLSIMTLSIMTLDTKVYYAEFHLSWMLFTLSLANTVCWKSLRWMSLCWVLLCWVSLCWVSWRHQKCKCRVRNKTKIWIFFKNPEIVFTTLHFLPNLHMGLIS